MEVQRARYLKDVFAGMALVYGLVRWLRIATQLLDQWLTLPIFAWLVAWRLSLDGCLSLGSYGLALLHPCGFEVALGAHIAAAVGQALRP
ncbi:hypothetical protein GH733_019575 [Mirounga leonina]|nr:hypothetical protein GH733_019575 [Mirounga leonina]